MFVCVFESSCLALAKMQANFFADIRNLSNIGRGSAAEFRTRYPDNYTAESHSKIFTRTCMRFTDSCLALSDPVSSSIPRCSRSS
eukprot:m.139575 g.139575  ORF g.139575 m.139575 type:complete len:85 (+) comp14019_c0_seq4:89-343(+)